MTLQVCAGKDRARKMVENWKMRGEKTGFVPTMGALHQGHISLVRASAAECSRTVVSIFLNPAQFGEDEDLERYPRQPSADLAELERAGADMVFTPEHEEMYPENFSTWVVQEGLAEKLCGAFRPGHFRGVCTVVAKLFAIVPANNAYFGRKDFQQTVVVKRMVRDLDMTVNIRIMPTVREKDGLACSSRNVNLSPEQRARAACLCEALHTVREEFRNGQKDPGILADSLQARLANECGIRPQYAEIVDPETLERPPAASSDSVAAVAAFIGDTRLIDNMPLGGDPGDIYLE